MKYIFKHYRTHRPRGYLFVLLQIPLSIMPQRLVFSDLFMIMPQVNATCLFIEIQHWFWLCLGDVRQNAISRANFDIDVCHQMAPLGQNELKKSTAKEFSPKFANWYTYLYRLASTVLKTWTIMHAYEFAVENLECTLRPVVGFSVETPWHKKAYTVTEIDITVYR